MDSVNLRNLEQIQETDADPRASRAAAFLLAGVGGAALLVAGALAMKQSAPASESRADPIEALVQKARRPDLTPPDAVQRAEVTFPAILSDTDRPTTALAAVKDERGKLVGPDPLAAAAPAEAPPPPADKLPVVPLPAGTLLDATPVTTQPKDRLSVLATEVSSVKDRPEAIPGGEGGFQLQVASFRDQAEADRFAAELRKRGHRAYRQAAHAPERGMWHRVRIGPFKTKIAAQKYKADLDRKERMTTFLVDPEKVKRQEEMRASKLAAIHGDER